MGCLSCDAVMIGLMRLFVNRLARNQAAMLHCIEEATGIQLTENAMEAVINISQDLYSSLSFFGLTAERIVSDSRQLLALKYFQAKFLSLGKAAELAGMSRIDFIEYLSGNAIPVIDYDAEEMGREFEAAEKVAQALLS